MVRTRMAARAEAWVQKQSPFFRLPQEIRDEIYRLVFSTAELAFDNRRKNGVKHGMTHDNTSTVSLLRACRRISDEIGDRWITQVWFSFYDLLALLRVLTVMPPRSLSKIRLLRLFNPLLQYVYGRKYNKIACYTCSLDSVLGILPGLRLDKLVVHASWYHRFEPVCEYTILDKLIRHGDGWKELHYIFPDSTYLAWGSGRRGVPDIPRRQGPQPQQWESVLEARDGVSSRPSVTIHRANPRDDVAPTTGSAKGPRLANWMDVGGYKRDDQGSYKSKDPRYNWLDKSTQWCLFTGDFYRDDSVPFEQHVPDGVAAADYGYAEDPFLMDPAEQWKGLHIVVKRGSGVDYTAKPGSPLIARRLSSYMPSLTWAKMRRHIPQMEKY